MTNQLTRRNMLTILLGGAAAMTMSPALAQSMPSAQSIERKLSAPSRKIAPNKRISIDEIKRNRQMRRIAPSINIQSINFSFGSARIGGDQQWKVQRIAAAMNRILRRNPYEVFLIEGHTDAVGSRQSNYLLSQARAHSLARELMRYGVRRSALETIGYGEDDLLIPTQREEWRNRRVTLRRITDFIILR